MQRAGIHPLLRYPGSLTGELFDHELSTQDPSLKELTHHQGTLAGGHCGRKPASQPFSLTVMGLMAAAVASIFLVMQCFEAL